MQIYDEYIFFSSFFFPFFFTENQKSHRKIFLTRNIYCVKDYSYSKNIEYLSDCLHEYYFKKRLNMQSCDNVFANVDE